MLMHSEKEELIEIETKVYIPRVLIEKKCVSYVYYMETPEKDSKTGDLKVHKEYENLFKECSEMRVLSIELEKKQPDTNISNIIDSRNDRLTRNAHMHPRASQMAMGGGGGGGMNNLNQQNQMLITVEQYDGLILFGDVKYSNKKELIELKQASVKQFLTVPLQSLLDYRVGTLNAKLNETFKRINECLCASDPICKDIFDLLLVETIMVRLRHIQNKTNNKMDDNEITSLITIFYYINLFQLKFDRVNESNKNIYEFILKALNNPPIYYHQNIGNIFNSPTDRKQICEYMKEFLTKTNKSYKFTHAFNILTIFYSLSVYSQNEKESSGMGGGGGGMSSGGGANEGQFIDQLDLLINFLDYTFPYDSNNVSQNATFNNIISIHRDYVALFQNSIPFSVLYLNYFTANNINAIKIIYDNLQVLNQTTNPFAVNSLVNIDTLAHYMLVLLRKNKESETKGADLTAFNQILDYAIYFYRDELTNFTNNSRELLVRFCKQQSHATTGIQEISISKLHKIRHIFSEFIQYNSKEWRTIVNILYLLLIFYEASDRIRESQSNSGQRYSGLDYDLNDVKRSAFSEIEFWLGRECQEDIKLTYGLKQRTNEDIRYYEQMMQERRRDRDRDSHGGSHNRRPRDYPRGMMGLAYPPSMRGGGDMDDEYEEYDYPRNSMMSDLMSMMPGIGGGNLRSKRTYHIGTSEEPAIYDQLFRLPVVNFNVCRSFTQHVKEILEKRLKNSEFESLLEVRAQMDSIKNRFRMEKDFSSDFDMAIIKHLGRNDSKIEDTKKLVDIIRNEKLLQFYVKTILDQWRTQITSRDNIASHLSQLKHSNEKDKVIKKYLELKFILKCSSFNYLYEISESAKHKKGQIINVFDLETATMCKQHMQSFDDAIRNMITGNDHIFIIQLIEANYENALKLLKTYCQSEIADKSFFNDGLTAIFAKLLQFRKNEINAFIHYYKNIKLFTSRCRKYNTCDLAEYDKLVSQLSDLDTVTGQILKNYVKILTIDEIRGGRTQADAYKPNIIYFSKINPDLMAIIDDIVGLEPQNCQLFDKYFAEESGKVMIATGNKKIEMETILLTIWKIVRDRWYQVAKSIDAGDIKLTQIDYYENEFYGTLKKMINEFKYILTYFRFKNFTQRNKQIELYSKFRTTVDGAREIEKIRKTLKLEDEFSELKPLLNINTDQFKDWNLLHMDDNDRADCKCVE